MRRVGRVVLAVAGVLALSACAAKYAQVAPRLDLEPYGRIALVTFSADGDKADLSKLATQRFAEAVLQSQSGIELLELGVRDSVLKNLAGKGIPAVFLGQLTVSGTKARGRLTNVTDLSVKAEVKAELAVQLVSTSTGGTMWRSSSAASGTVGQVSLRGGLPSVAAREADEAYADVVAQLITEVTRDFRPTYVRQ